MVKIKVIVDVLVENCWGIVDQSPLTCDDNNNGNIAADCGELSGHPVPHQPTVWFTLYPHPAS